MIRKWLTFWFRRVLEETCLFRKALKIDYLEGLLQHYTLESYQIERSVIENGWFIPKSPTEYFVFVAKY